MLKWLPEGLIVFGSLLGGMSLFFPERRGMEKADATEMPAEVSIGGNDCGAISLYLICRISGASSSLDEIRRLTKTSLTGTSMFDIMEAAEQQGFEVRGVRCSFESLSEHLSGRGRYAILYFKSGHFDPAVQATTGKIRTIDTSRLEIKECAAEDLKSLGWDETALLLRK